MFKKRSNIRVLNVAIAVLTITVLAIVVVAITVTILNLKLENKVIEFKQKALERQLDTSIVRLHDLQGRFFCSGVVISESRILTAAHCILRESLFGMEAVPKVEIRTQSNSPRQLYATPEADNDREDIAILKGDFRGLQVRPIIVDSAKLNSIFMNPDSKIIACGYPAGGPLRCSHVDQVDRMLFFFSARGWLYPGMSGGPVFDGSGNVIAVNQAVTEIGRIIVSPLIELFDNLGLNESANK